MTVLCCHDGPCRDVPQPQYRRVVDCVAVARPLFDRFFNSYHGYRAASGSSSSPSTIDLAFWESVATVPAGTHVVGVPVHDCGPELSTIVFPPRKAAKHKADEFRRDFNCGLALIRQNGVMASICASSTHPGGDPHCILDGPAPTVQCLADNAR